MYFKFNGYTSRSALHASVSKVEGFLNNGFMVEAEAELRVLLEANENVFVLGSVTKDMMFGATMLYYAHVNGVDLPGVPVPLASSTVADHVSARMRVMLMVLRQFSEEVDA